MKTSTVIINNLIDNDRKGAFSNFRQYKDNLSCVNLQNMIEQKNIQFLQSLAQQAEQTEISPIWFEQQSTQNKMKMLKIYQYSILVSQNIFNHYDGICSPIQREVEERVKNLQGLKKEILNNKDQIKKKKWRHDKLKLQSEKDKLKLRQKELQKTKNSLLAHKKALSKTNMLLAQEIELADSNNQYPIYIQPPSNYIPYNFYQYPPQYPPQYQQPHHNPQPHHNLHPHSYHNYQNNQHHPQYAQNNQHNGHQTHPQYQNPQIQGQSYQPNGNLLNLNQNQGNNSANNSIKSQNGNNVAPPISQINKNEQSRNLKKSAGIRNSQRALTKNSEYISDSFFNPGGDQETDVKITDSRLTKKKDSVIGNESKKIDLSQKNYSPTNRITSQNIKESIKKSKFNPMKISEAASEAYDEVGQLQENTYIENRNEQRSQSRKSSGGQELQELSSLMNVKLNTESHNEIFSHKGKKDSKRIEKKTSILAEDNSKGQDIQQLWDSKIRKKDEGSHIPKIKIKQQQHSQSFLENSKLGTSKNLNKNISIPAMKIKQNNSKYPSSRLSDSLDSQILDESSPGKKTPEPNNLASSTSSDYKDDSLWQSNDGKKVDDFHAGGGLKVKMKSPGKNSTIKDEIIQQEQQYQHSFQDYEQDEPNNKTRVKVDIGSDSSPEKNMRKFSPLVKNNFILKQSYKNLENSKAASMDFSDFGELGENSVKFQGTQKKLKLGKSDLQDMKMEQIQIPEGSYIAKPSANKNSTIHKSSSIQKMSFRQPKNNPSKSVTVSQFSAQLQNINKKTIQSDKNSKGEGIRDSFKKYDTLNSIVSDKNKPSAISNKGNQGKIVSKFQNTAIPNELTESHIINHDNMESNDDTDPLLNSDEKLMRSGQSLLSVIEEDTEQSKFTNPEAAKKIKLLIDRKYKQNGAFEFDKNLIKKKIEEVAGDLQDMDWEEAAKKFQLMAKKQQNQLKLLNQKIQKKKKVSRQGSLASSKNRYRQENIGGIKDQISNPIQKSSYAQDDLNYSVSVIQNNSSKGKNIGVKIIDKREEVKKQKQKQIQEQRQENKNYLRKTTKVKTDELNKELKLIHQKNRFQKDDEVGDLGDLMALEEKTVKSKTENEQDW